MLAWTVPATAETPRCRYSFRFAARADAIALRNDVSAAFGRALGLAIQTVPLETYFDTEIGAWMVWGEIEGMAVYRDGVATELRSLLSRGLARSYLYTWSSHLDTGRGGADDAATMTREVR